ncbi:MAG: hypothetical protein AAFN13_06720 [Bacteroidota bacterium]
MRYLLVLLALTFVGSLTASAQNQRVDNRYQRDIDRKLAVMDYLMSDRGFSRSHDHTIDFLYEGQRDGYTLNLDAGRTYHFMATCDEDCNDIDLRLYTYNGRLIQSNTRSDSLPIITFRPSYSGTYRIEADMYSCSTEPCYYGIGIYR